MAKWSLKIDWFDRLREADKALAGKRAVQPIVWLFLVPLFTFFTWMSFRQSIDAPREVLLAIGIGDALGKMLGVFAVSPLIARRRGPNTHLILLALICASGIPVELFKINQLGIGWGFVPDRPNAWLVLVTSTLIAVTWLLLSTLTVVWFKDARAELGALHEAERELAALAGRLNELLADKLKRLQEQLDQTLRPTIESLRDKVAKIADSPTSAELLRVSGEIRDFCDSEVRQLSHELAADPAAAVAATSRSRASFWSSFVAVWRLGDVPPRFVFWMIVILAVPYGLNDTGPQSIPLVLLGLPVGFLAIKYLDAWRRRLLNRHATWAHFWTAAAMYVLVAEISAATINLMEPLYPNLLDFIDALWWLVPLALLLIWYIAGAAFGARNLVQQTTAELLERNRQNRMANDELRARLAAARSRIYRLVHGTVQGRLAAVSLALAAVAKESDEVKRGELLRQALAQLETTTTELHAQFALSSAPIDFEEQYAQMAGGWRNLIELTLDASEDVLARLSNDPYLADELLGAIQEGITNAHRHGHAKRVDLQVLIDSDQLELRISNPVGLGTAAESKGQSGSGIDGIAKTAQSVKFSRGQDLSILTATWKLNRTS